MANRITHLLVLVSIAAALAACSSSPSRFYTLTSAATPPAAPAATGYIIGVGPVSVPGQVDRQPFTIQVAPNRIEIDEFNRWAAPLDEAIARVVAEDLATLLGTQHVATLPLANFDPTYRVTIDIQRFDSLRRQEKNEAVLVEALWVVRKAGGPGHSGRTIAREPTQGDGFDALAAAHSRALAKVSADIAAAIRAQAEETP